MSLLRTLCLICLLTLAACGPLNPVSLLTGGGPNVAANVQAGETNTQTIGTTAIQEQSIVRPQARDITQTADENKIRTEKVDNLTINETPIWMIVLLVLGWLLPSPSEMGRGLLKVFRRG